MVVLGELAEVAVALEVVDVGAVLRGLEVVDGACVVEVAVDVAAVVSGAEVAGPERVAAGDLESDFGCHGFRRERAGDMRYRVTHGQKRSTSRRVE